MEEFKESLLIIITTPIYAIIIGLEILFSFLHERHYYTTKGTLSNIYLSLLNGGLDILMRTVCLGVMFYFFQFHFVHISNPILYWTLLLIFQDFMFYILHTVDHYVRFFWAVHVTHHSSQEFNLTVGFRSSVFQPLYRFLYFIPLALTGFDGKDVMLMYSITQIYGILIHTQYIKKLGFVEKFLSTPSHHRVHHGSNTIYLDKNMGMVFIFWDKLFGTYQEEQEEVRYGLTKNIETYHPIKMVFHEWINIYKDCTQSNLKLKHRFMYVFGPPGWSHDGRSLTSVQMREELEQGKKANQ
jgi:sterol desaturase/sphingolipid hydroxylase (fatty acid hydroxylase superfamily)